MSKKAKAVKTPTKQQIADWMANNGMCSEATGRVLDHKGSLRQLWDKLDNDERTQFLSHFPGNEEDSVRNAIDRIDPETIAQEASDKAFAEAEKRQQAAALKAVPFDTMMRALARLVADSQE